MNQQHSIRLKKIVDFFDNTSNNELILNLARNNNSYSLINIDTGFFIHSVKPGIN